MRKIILTDVAWIEPISFDEENRDFHKEAIATIYIDVNHVDVYFGSVEKQFFSAIEEKIKEVCWEEEIIILNIHNDKNKFAEFLDARVFWDRTEIAGRKQSRFTRKRYVF
jgi:hypothetical protein